MSIDYEREGLLAGAEDDEARAARRVLLDELVEDGVELEELRQAVTQDRLVLLPVERAVSGERRYTPEQITELSGLPLGFLAENRRAMGLPLDAGEGPAYGEEDLEAARRVKRFLDAGLPEEGLLDTARVLGQSMAKVAAATRDLVGPAFLERGISEDELARRYRAAAEELGPSMGHLLGYQYKQHLIEGLKRDVVGRHERESGEIEGSERVTAAFADLEGFTRLGEQLSSGELGQVARRLGDLAADVAQPPVRLVKTIGDAAMMVAPDAESMLAAAIELVERADALGDDFPRLRAGVAGGQALSRAGDWYGRPINMASRITAIARPGSVLASEDVHSALSEDDGFTWSFAGERHLKGIEGGVKVYRARVAVPAGESEVAASEDALDPS